MAKELSTSYRCIDCDMEITYNGMEAPKEVRCSKCQKTIDEKDGRKTKKASK